MVSDVEDDGSSSQPNATNTTVSAEAAWYMFQATNPRTGEVDRQEVNCRTSCKAEFAFQ